MPSRATMSAFNHGNGKGPPMSIYRALVGSICLLTACGGPDGGSATAPRSGAEADRPDTLQSPAPREPVGTLKPSGTKQTSAQPSRRVSACLVQDGQRLAVRPLRAVGTEPFWGARIEGRCVTYSHPQDQRGTRIWTRYTSHPNGGVWIGAVAGQRFELRTLTQPGCSDGMSDRKYPMAVQLLVEEEQRKGCAGPL